VVVEVSLASLEGTRVLLVVVHLLQLLLDALTELYRIGERASLVVSRDRGRSGDRTGIAWLREELLEGGVLQLDPRLGLGRVRVLEPAIGVSDLGAMQLFHDAVVASRLGIGDSTRMSHGGGGARRGLGLGLGLGLGFGVGLRRCVGEEGSSKEQSLVIVVEVDASKQPSCATLADRFLDLSWNRMVM